MRPLTKKQIQALRAAAQRQIPAAVCGLSDFDSRSGKSLRNRGLIRADASTGWIYVVTEQGRAELARLEALER